MGGGYRASDEALDREIATLEGIARLRLRRYTREFRDLDRDLRDLRRERARRRAEGQVPDTNAGTTAEESSG